MKVPAKGKAVIADRQILFSTGEVTEGKLLVNYCNDLKGCTKYVESWQEVEITFVVYAPEDGKICAV